MTTDYVWWPLCKQVDAVKNQEISALELAESYVKRIRDFDGRLSSYVTRNDQILEQADAVDSALKQGKDCGPLAGAFLSIKDNYLTPDLETRAGTSIKALEFPKTDSSATRRLRKAGALILGKVRMHEFAWGNVTAPTRNPWNEAYVPGGSSGGSGAAVAAALCAASMGTDTGGSVRIPATICGTVGLKPTYGLVNSAGIVPHSWSLDHAGPLTRTVEDAALLLDVLASGPERPSSLGATSYREFCKQTIQGRRVGIIRNHFTEQVSGDVADIFAESLAWLRSEGVTVEEFDVPLLEYGLGAIFAIELASSSAYHDHAVQNGWTQQCQDDVRDLIDMGRLVTAVDYLHAEQIRTLLCAEFAKIFEHVDVIMTPTAPIPAWECGTWEVDINGVSESVLAASWRFTYPFNLTGLPAISVPAGFDHKGLPIGLQFAAKPFDEAAIFAFAGAHEQAHQVYKQRPAAYR